MRLSAPIFRLKREAKRLARQTDLTHLAALDQLAVSQGFRSWSHLAATGNAQSSAKQILDRLDPGDLMLLAARPGHGKTLLGISILAEAAKQGREAAIFTLDYTETNVADRLTTLGVRANALPGAFRIDTSDDICASYITEHLISAPAGSVTVIDYLQLIDQRRTSPPLETQVRSLASFAAQTGNILVCNSQVARDFENSAKAFPDQNDIRLPNPVDLNFFSKWCFLHDGTVQMTCAA